MDSQMIFNIIIIVLLTILIVLHLVSRKKSDLSQIESLLKKNAKEQRDEVGSQLSAGATEQFKRFGEIGARIQSALQTSRIETNDQLGNFSEQTQKTLQRNREESNRQLREFQEQMISTLEVKMKSLQDSNEKRLEQMQGIVDEKLQKTLETRLTQSFETVGKHLESVQQGLGEMKGLAQDARSLKHALTNVKDRGTYGEVRLERLLEDILTTSQYEKNANISDGKVVEFAIKLPGNGETPLLLPIDAKFPIEDYNRLIAAEDKSEIESARKALIQSIRNSAKDISAKYVMPPKTTNFALMFLPTEGLYAEVIRDATFFEELREKYKVIAVGATTLSAFLGSLQIGFKTLSIEKRSGEVWDTLSKVKLEFTRFQGALNTAHKQIKTAEGTLERLSGTRMRAIERALRNVEELNGSDVTNLLDLNDIDIDDIEEVNARE